MSANEREVVRCNGQALRASWVVKLLIHAIMLSILHIRAMLCRRRSQISVPARKQLVQSTLPMSSMLGSRPPVRTSETLRSTIQHQSPRMVC